MKGSLLKKKLVPHENQCTRTFADVNSLLEIFSEELLLILFLQPKPPNSDISYAAVDSSSHSYNHRALHNIQVAFGLTFYNPNSI